MLLIFADSFRFASSSSSSHLIFLSSSFLALFSMPRKRASEIRRARQAAFYKQNRNLPREANAPVRVAIFQVAEPHVEEFQVAEPHVEEFQVAEPQVAELQVAEPQVAEFQALQPPAIDQKVLDERTRQALEIFNAIQALRRGIPPQLLPPVEILAQQAARYFQFRKSNQPVPPREDEQVPQLAIEDGDVLQLAIEDGDVLQLAYEDEA
jgi:hypothetical protein